VEHAKEIVCRLALGTGRAHGRFERQQVAARIGEMLVALGEVVVEESVELRTKGLVR
jgi:hypothetical protein